jgi:hypothetical protein
MLESQIAQGSTAEAATPASSQPEAQAGSAGMVSLVNPTDGVATAPETKPEAPKAKPEDDLSARFAALTRKEKKILEAERKAKELLEKYTPLEEALTQKDALKLLERAGLSINDVLDAAIKQGEPPSMDDKVKSLEERLAAYEREKQEALEKAQRDAQLKAAEAEVTAFKQTIEKQIKEGGEKFELIELHNAYDAIYEACFEIVSNDPESYQTRAQAEALIPRVAEMIEAELSKSLETLKASKKLKALLGIADAGSALDAATGSQTQSSAPEASPFAPAKAKFTSQDVTLTNRTAAIPAQPDSKPRPKTREESLAQAAALYEQLVRAKQQGQSTPR